MNLRSLMEDILEDLCDDQNQWQGASSRDTDKARPLYAVA